MKIEKWYRGHETKNSPMLNRGIIWLTDDIEYAQDYANNYNNGCVSVVYVDEDKLNIAPLSYFDFDYYFPTKNDIEEMKREGYNSYAFETGDEYYCLALFDKTPIVKTEIEQVNLDDAEKEYVVSEVIKRLNETTDTSEYQQLIMNILAEINEYLTDFGLSCTLNTKYDFSGYYKDCVAVYQYRSVMNNGKMRVAINLPLIMSHDDIDIEEQIRISLWHEVGHGIVQWIKSLRRKDTQMKTNIFKGQIVKDLRYILNNEEDVVEEFGEYQSDVANYSILDYFIRDYNEILKPE